MKKEIWKVNRKWSEQIIIIYNGFSDRLPLWEN